MEKLLTDFVLSPAWYFTAARGVTLILIVMTIAGYSVLLERKASAWIQGRIGPNRTMHPLIGWIPFVGTFLAKGGFIQPAADGVQLDGSAFAAHKFPEGKLLKFAPVATA